VYDLRHVVAHRFPAEAVEQREARRLLAPLVLREREFDVVCVEQIGLAPLLPSRHSALWLSTLHYLPSIQARQLGALAGRRQRWFWAREAVKAARLERWTARLYDRVIVCSDDDAAALGEPAVTVPNGVDVERFLVTPVPNSPRIVAVGTLNYLPNVDGLEWFATEVLPLIQQRKPEAQLVIVGRDPVAAIRALTRLPGVQLHADVPRVEPYVEAARVAIVPLRVGAGTRLKALEAMAGARPVVGTSIGLAGLDVIDGVHARVRDDAAGFSAAVVELLGDDDAATRLANAGRALVEEHYSWREIGGRYAEWLGSLRPSSR
jgi:glycosyltransferase involved in cell wall biosynthesis